MILWMAVALAPEPGIEPAHAENTLYSQIRQSGVTIDGHRVRLPAPMLPGGHSAADERATCTRLAGWEQPSADPPRDRVSAPVIVKLHDEPTEAGTLIRLGALWFVAYGNLDAIAPAHLTRQEAAEKP